MADPICENPVFVVGAPRSGTSMMQWALRAHSNLWGGQESDFLIPMHQALVSLHAFGSRRGKLHWLSGQGVSLSEFVEYVGRGVNALYTNRSGGRRWVEQTPEYTLHMEEMLALFPGASFLWMVRDGRQVVHSLRNFVNEDTRDHAKACETWVAFTRAALGFIEGRYGARAFRVDYEDMVANPEDGIRKVCEFLREPFETAPVSFIRDKAPINSSFRSESAADKLAPRWVKWSQVEREQFATIAGELLIQLGYEADNSWVDVLE